jgi:hypothetical protein
MIMYQLSRTSKVFDIDASHQTEYGKMFLCILIALCFQINIKLVLSTVSQQSVAR